MKYLLLLFVSTEAMAWGKHGHALVNQAAAYALVKENSSLKTHSFDLGYYANVPDIIWRRPETNEIERDEHYIDLEIFERAMGKKYSDPTAWLEDRRAMLKTYPTIKKAGFAFWRIAELCKELEKVSNILKAKNKDSKKTRHAQQVKWLSIAGSLGHYVGDLSQPLHNTENYDGQQTNQKGVHAFYETEVVNELYPTLAGEVFERAKKIYTELQPKKNESCFNLARELSLDSAGEIGPLLANDKKTYREVNQAEVYRKQITLQLGRGAGYLAVIWAKYADVIFDEKDFFNFDEHPQYIKPR